ncbi:FHA domain-containing protein [Paraburkholderia phytofirmans]|uniref:YscD cytoplasmic domain-containing protein n=1 Tax=Paraburkholderia phytofirmans (strain DSM 17436 / LMG 22146 / PsJN) TaxID=398527 RepID=B2TD04_PARPJ|nr:FHA domain-containing protein [Paraburkholderia phytofirmans]ACD19578.1 conserved hypothetical protein [Paraburkholderia phytofirmans PsJN]
MSTGGIIIVTGGIHAGASVLLSDSHDLTIGSGEGASLLLADDGIAPHHATIRLTGNRLKLTALHDGVSVFGYPLASGKTTVLMCGASFMVGDAQLQFSGRDLLTPDVMRNAELAWLMTHAPLAYISKRWTHTSRGAKLLLLTLMASAGLGSLWRIYGPHELERTLPRLDGPFRFVTVREDVKTHAYVYEGYVMSSSELASLAANARRDTRSPVIRVIVVEQMKEQLVDFLQKYYRDAQVRPDEPGSFTVSPPAEEAYAVPESWDYKRVTRLARESINGLRTLRFEGHVADQGPVRVPLQAIGMNLAHSAHGAWLVDQQGVRYFTGARLPLGRIASISNCTVKIVRNDDGATYEFFAEGAENARTCK